MFINLFVFFGIRVYRYARTDVNSNVKKQQKDNIRRGM